MPVSINHNLGTNTLTVQIVLERLFDVTEGEAIKMVVQQVVDKITEDYLNTHSAEILSKLNIEQIANLATLELGKRAAKVAEGKK